MPKIAVLLAIAAAFLEGCGSGIQLAPAAVFTGSRS